MGTELRPLEWSWLGRIGYAEAVSLQESTREDVRAGRRGDQLLLLEHPPVYTLGRNAGAADVTAPPEWLASRGIEVFEADRGGQVTYHGPGQLVGYPIVNLSPDRQDIRRYVRGLQEVLVRVLGDFGLEAEGRREQPEIGVWVGDTKVASLGIHIKRWVTTHGFALNVTTDLAHFAGIVPCGLRGVPMASIESLTGRRPGLEVVADRLVRRFCDVFGYEAEASSAGAARAEGIP